MAKISRGIGLSMQTWDDLDLFVNRIGLRHVEQEDGHSTAVL